MKMVAILKDGEVTIRSYEDWQDIAKEIESVYGSECQWSVITSMLIMVEFKI